jgi:hypothetical protein
MTLKRLTRLSEKGISHIVVPVFIIALIAVLGGYTYSRISNAATVANAGYIDSGVSGKCLDDYYDASTEGTKADSYSCNKSSAQQWTLHSAANGSFTIENENGACLDNWGRLKLAATRLRCTSVTQLMVPNSGLLAVMSLRTP